MSDFGVRSVTACRSATNPAPIAGTLEPPANFLMTTGGKGTPALSVQTIVPLSLKP